MGQIEMGMPETVGDREYQRVKKASERFRDAVWLAIKEFRGFAGAPENISEPERTRMRELGEAVRDAILKEKGMKS